MPVEYIDFRALRQRLRIADVLRYYDVQLKVSGDRATGLCPLPTHPQRERGKRTASFSVSMSRGLWNCFGCKMGGSVIDLAIRMEGKSPDDPSDVRSVALKLVRAFKIDTSDAPNPPKAAKRGVNARKSVGAAEHASHEDSPQIETIVNAPLDFELKLDPHHLYLASRGLSPATIQEFGIGFCSRGLLKDRIAIPLHDPAGQLVGYVGRLVDDELIDDEHPKYLLPGPRERDGKRYELRKSELLFNAYRIERPVDRLIVVEGLMSVFWLTQHGYSNIVALMGSDCSDAQAALVAKLLRADGELIVFTDGDDAGQRCAGDLFVRLGDQFAMRYARLADGEQPTDLDADELDAVLK
ncbi:MAG TPA: CHC2 zinc finger domain-containing protein [Tepidisphaeraceae bacterium]|nr:CHC2 zinc finger domain-containing protein [Tepidisphaeraceae bacterium]